MKRLIIVAATVIFILLIANVGVRLHLWQSHAPYKKAPMLDGYASFVWKSWKNEGTLPSMLSQQGIRTGRDGGIGYKVLDPVERRFSLCARIDSDRLLEIDYQLTETGAVRCALRVVP